MKIYGDKKSGNCLKLLYVSTYLGLGFEWVDVDILKGESRTEESLSLNPSGQVPYVVFSDGRVLSQSNAIMLHLAHNSSLIPTDAWLTAKLHQWLFWEQYSHEPTIAVCRFQMHYLGKPKSSLDPEKVSKGNAALDLMDDHLSGCDWFVGSHLSLADIGLVAYTRVAHEGGFDLKPRPALCAWVERVEKALSIH